MCRLRLPSSGNRSRSSPRLVQYETGLKFRRCQLSFVSLLSLTNKYSSSFLEISVSLTNREEVFRDSLGVLLGTISIRIFKGIQIRSATNYHFGWAVPQLGSLWEMRKKEVFSEWAIIRAGIRQYGGGRGALQTIYKFIVSTSRHGDGYASNTILIQDVALLKSIRHPNLLLYSTEEGVCGREITSMHCKRTYRS